MNSSCASPYPGLTNPNVKELSLAALILFPICVFVFILVFWFKKDSSVFLRKRSIYTVIFVGLGSLVTWAVSVVYDYVGPANYPCWLLMLFTYSACPALFAPGILAVFDYVAKISSLRLENAMRKKLDQESKVDADTDNDRKNNLNLLEPELSCSSFYAYIRIAYFGSRDEADRIGNAKFQKTIFSRVFHLLINASPYIIAFVVRFAMNPQWVNCSGCEVPETDAILIIVFMWATLMLALFSFSFKVKKADALRVVREWLYTWTVSSILTTVVYILYLTDPGDIYADGMYNYRELLALCALVAVYINTIHQVFISSMLKQKLLLLPTLNQSDRFDDVMRDKALYQQLSNYLDEELSSEILRFLRAVETYKMSFNTAGKDGPARKAREIAEMFIEPRSLLEINISHDVRQALLEDTSKGNVTINTFDPAYDIIKYTLLVDGFARFLHKLEIEDNVRQSSNKTVSPLVSSSPI